MTSPFARNPCLLPPGKHGYRGVRMWTDARRAKPYFARTKFEDCEIYSRSCATAEEAAQAYDELALKYHGDKAVLNFPKAPLSTDANAAPSENFLRVSLNPSPSSKGGA